MPKVRLTVLLATRNGQNVLPRVLEGYRRLLAPSIRWKLLIVDNGSTDATPQIIDTFKRDLPIEVLHRPIAGKTRALNTGLQAVEGELVIFTDDDSIPSPAFLIAWAKFLSEGFQYDLFGGSIEPLFDTAVPKWMSANKRRFEMMFARRDLPEGPTTWDEIYGANMMVRRSIFESGIRFDEGIGPNSLDSNYPMGSESELCMRLAKAGARCWFAKEPQVHHIVRPEQLHPAAWAKRAYRSGRGRAHLMRKRGLLPEDSITPSSLLDRAIQSARDNWAWLKTLSPSPAHRFENICAYHTARGFRDECSIKHDQHSDQRPQPS